MEESGEGTMHTLRRIASAEPCNTECKVAHQERVLLHIEVQEGPRGVKRAPGGCGSLELTSGRENAHFSNNTYEKGIQYTKNICDVG